MHPDALDWGVKSVFFQETEWTLRPDVLDWGVKSNENGRRRLAIIRNAT